LNVVIFGATGMVGAGALLECLDARGVQSVLVIGRHPCGVVHEKVVERVVDDLFDLGSLRDALADRDACFYCLGVSVVGTTEDAYRRTTYELTLSIARTLRDAAPRMVFLFVSAEGADSSERGRVMWARVKGQTENAVLGLGFRNAYVFRPALVQPLRGIRSRTRWYRVFYRLAGPVMPVLRRLAPQYVTTTAALGRAMIRVAADGYPAPVLRTRDINRIAGAA
jgi:uncharacterized protein YbjT (DUF2867 family)